MKTTSHHKSTIISWVRTQTKFKVVSVIFGMLAIVLPFAGTGQTPEKASPPTTEQPPIKATTERTPVKATIAGQATLSPDYRAKLEKRAVNAVKQIKGEKAMIEARPEPERLFVEKTQKLFKQATSATRWDSEQQARFEHDAKSLIEQSQNLWSTGCFSNCNAQANRCYNGCRGGGGGPTEIGECNVNCLLDHLLCNGGCMSGPLGVLFQKL